MQKLDGKTQNIVADNVEQLRQLFPEAFTEGKVDFDMLRNLLGDNVEPSDERYSFNWYGKSDAIKVALKQSSGTLRPDRESSKNWDDTQNLYIEGDNLEVLRIMQSSYRNKVKMIYIDPPYNTGKDFVYTDNFDDTVADYKEKIGEKFKTNANSSGRYHTNWLNMMYPRLKLARNLLTDDGMIFVSIGKEELDNTMKLLKEVFGENNYISTITRITKKTSDAGNYFAPSTDFVIACAKQVDNLSDFKIALSDSQIGSFNLEDEKGKYKVVGFYQASLSLERSRNARYSVECPDGSSCIPPEGKRWRTVRETYQKFIEEDKIVFKQTKSSPLLDQNGNQSKWNIYTKSYVDDRIETGVTPRDFIDNIQNNSGTRDLKDLGLNKYFDFPKPIKLIGFLNKLLFIEDNDIILDFFSGSSATAHATMKLNAEDGGNRKFIMVQLPEETDEKSEAYKAGYKTIPEIGRERIRRAGEKILVDSAESLAERATPLDIGFKAFKLDTTNLAQWDEKTQDVEATIFDNIDAVKGDRNQEDLVYEVLLKYGVDISVPIETEKLDGKTLYKIAGGYLTLCLDEGLDQSFIEKLAEQKPERLVFRDTGFVNDTVKINAEMTLKKHGITDIKVL